MKYILLVFFFVTSTQSQRTNFGFLSSDQVQFNRHTSKAIDRFLSDEELQKIFPISDYFYPSTRFWFLIYTYFDDSKLVIHDRNNLNLIYQIQDFSSLESKNVHPFAQSFIQEEFIKKKVITLKNRLLLLADNPLPKDVELVEIYNLVVKAGVDIGKNAKEHKKVFTNLSKSIRTQRGLKNHIEAGLTRYNHYSLFLDQYFEAHKLPKELVAISFLESSFNPYAHSKSKAVGVWQFMPFLQRSFFPIHANVDYRLNIGISSVAAATLLKENRRILKRWDLAVTAYNSGIKHILKDRKNNPTLTLEELIQKSENSNFGFASKNFYAEFLALTRVLKHRDDLFPAIQFVNPLPELNFYIAKCDINLLKSFKSTERNYLKSLNHQLAKTNVLSRGTLVTTDSRLSSVFYEKVSQKDLVAKKPKNWMNPKKRYSCSTR